MTQDRRALMAAPRRSRTRWTPAEDRIVKRDDISIVEMAFMLERSYQSICNRRVKLSAGAATTRRSTPSRRNRGWGQQCLNQVSSWTVADWEQPERAGQWAAHERERQLKTLLYKKARREQSRERQSNRKRLLYQARLDAAAERTAAHKAQSQRKVQRRATRNSQ